MNDPLHLRYLEDADFYPWFEKKNDKIFSGTSYFAPLVFYSDKEKSALESLKGIWGTRAKVLVGCFANERDKEPVGWSESLQVSQDELRMHVSAVEPEFRNRGIYAELLKMTVTKAKELGFQRISSYHHATNNAVIIPKLKQGFNIQGIECRDVGGTMVRLIYYINDERRRAFQMRTGQISPEGIYGDVILSEAKNPRVDPSLRSG